MDGLHRATRRGEEADGTCSLPLVTRTCRPENAKTNPFSIRLSECNTRGKLATRQIDNVSSLADLVHTQAIEDQPFFLQMKEKGTD
jgi:hypothetical protein